MKNTNKNLSKRQKLNNSEIIHIDEIIDTDSPDTGDSTTDTDEDIEDGEDSDNYREDLYAERGVLF